MMMDDGGPGAADAVEAVPAGGILVIRTWFERNGEPGFRARITYGRAGAGESSTEATTDPDEVLEVVRQWLSAQHPGDTEPGCP
jgi:hypothetical protein